MENKEDKLKIEIRNLSLENAELKSKLKELEESHKTTTTILVDTFRAVLNKNSKEIKLLREGKAKIEAELILKELKSKITALTGSEVKGK